MKILFSGYHNPHFLTITEYAERALSSLGHHVIVFDDRQHIIPGRIRRRMKWLHEFDLRHVNNQFVSLALNTKPGIAVVTGGHRILGDSVTSLRENGVFTALWTIDAPVNFEPILKTAALYDCVFCGGTEAQKILYDNGISDTHWLPFACSPDFHHHIALTDQEKKAYAKDVVFVGSFYSNRWEILRELSEFDIGIWGPHWNKAECETLGRLSIKDVQLTYSEWLKIFSATKIVIVIHYQDGKTPCYQASPKVYEALACKSFVLVDRQKDVFSLFNDGEHLVAFDNTEDLKQKVMYYLDHADERKRIATRGYREVLNKHTYSHRMGEMFAMVENGCHS